ncbi:MAG: transglutaminase-like domain-containing protein [Thermosynechococcaceae cyanobacterium]
MRQSIATLTSLALLFWGYQTGAWVLALLMVGAIEGKDIATRWGLTLERKKIIRRPQTLSWTYFCSIYCVGGVLWLLSIFYISPNTSSSWLYLAVYQLIKCLPVAFFPLILSQVYGVSFVPLLHSLLNRPAGVKPKLNLYYPYFGICLFAASATGGNSHLFLIITAALVAGFLWAVQQKSPVKKPQHRYRKSQRFNKTTFCFLMGLALGISLLGIQPLQWLQANTKLKMPSLLGDSAPNIASLPFQKETPSSAIASLLAKAQQHKTSNSSERPSQPPQFPQGASPTDVASSHNTEQSASLPQSFSGTEGASLEAESPSPQNSEGINADLPQNLQGTDPGENANANPNLTNGSPEDGDSDSPEGTNLGTDSVGGDAAQAIPQNASADAQPGSNQGNTSAPLGKRQGTGGTVDPETSVTQIGKRGSLELSDAILFRVAPAQSNRKQLPTVPFYIREATYNQYDDGAWNAPNSSFSPVKPGNNPRHWRLAPKTSKTASIRISAQQKQNKGILKLPIGTSEIGDLAADSLQVNPYGTVSIQGKPGALSYTVHFDPTQAFDSPPTLADRVIPPAERPALKRVLETLELSKTSDSEIVEAISAFFKDGFQYSLTLSQPEPDQTSIASFLLNHRSGHCEYYASATALLLREAGIPTRYAVGYSVHEYSPAEQQYLVRARNAHAWVMAYVDGTWVTVETTPSEGLSSAPAESTPEPQTSQNVDIRELPAQLSAVAESMIAESSDNLGSIVLLAALVVLMVAIALSPLFFLGWKLYRKLYPSQKIIRHRFSSSLPHEPEPEFHHIEQRLEQWGLLRSTSEPLKLWLLKLEQNLPQTQMNELKQIIDLHYRDRFDPQGIDTEDQAKLKTLTRDWLATYP